MDQSKVVFRLLLIDLGPAGGGGAIVCTGTPEEATAREDSYTGQYLKKVLERKKTGRGAFPRPDLPFRANFYFSETAIDNTL